MGIVLVINKGEVMLHIGLSWLLFWVLVNPLNVAVDVAALITGIAFVVLSFVLGDSPIVRRNP